MFFKKVKFAAINGPCLPKKAIIFRGRGFGLLRKNMHFNFIFWREFYDHIVQIVRRLI